MPAASKSSIYAIVALPIVALLNLTTPEPGSLSVVVVLYVNCALSPPLGKKSATVVKLPSLSKPSVLLALVAALSVNSAVVIVLVLLTAFILLCYILPELDNKTSELS